MYTYVHERGPLISLHNFRLYVKHNPKKPAACVFSDSKLIYYRVHMYIHIRVHIFVPMCILTSYNSTNCASMRYVQPGDILKRMCTYAYIYNMCVSKPIVIQQLPRPCNVLHLASTHSCYELRSPVYLPESRHLYHVVS